MTIIRPMDYADVEAVYEMASFAFSGSREEVLSRTPEEVERRKERQRLFLRHDPEGCWVAADEENGGRVVGVAAAIRREKLWILSLFVVEKSYRGGLGRGLLEKSLEYAEGTTGAMIASSTDPAAMRRYSLAGFDLHPTLTASGVVDRRVIPSNLSVRDGDESDLELAADVDRTLRGSSHGPDLEYGLSSGGRLLVSERGGERGYALVSEDTLRLVGATREDVASELLWAALAAVEPEKETEVRWITGRQNWAVRVALAARLSLSPGGPICTRGELGPLNPYLPSGPYL